MGRIILIGLIISLAVVFLGIGLGIYHFAKHIIVDGRPLIDQPVNKQMRTDKMGIGEFAVYGSMIGIAMMYAISVMERGAGGSAILARMIVLPPIMALFNARKRTGKSLFAVVISFALALFLMMAELIIGIPQKAPTLLINDAQITVTQTTTADLMKGGFDIYIRQEGNQSAEYGELLSSGMFEKYPADRSVTVEKGFQLNRDTVSYAPYLLVKEGIIVGSIDLYGDMNKDTVLEDCKIVLLRFDEDCIAAAKANSISYQLCGIDLLVPLKLEELQKAFGENLQFVLPDSADSAESYYTIEWRTNTDHRFWNEYFSTIRVDEENNMTSFELTGEIPRDGSE